MTDGLFTRLAKAREEFQKVGDFSKIKTDGLQFAYLPIEQAKPVIEQVTSKNGVTIIPLSFDIIDDRTERVDKPNNYGKVTSWLYMTAKITFRIACPEESIDIEIMAEAQDNSDKCINKVYTMAYKNLVKILFGFAESGKDDSKFDDAREQDNDFNQDPLFGTGRKTAPKAPAKPKAAPAQDPEKIRLIDELTEIMMGSTTDADIILTILDGKHLDDCTVAELKNIKDNVRPFGGA